MRRLALALALAAALAPGSSGGSEPARAQPGIDFAPQGPSPAERLEEIRRRVQAAVVYPTRARQLGLEGVARIQFQVGADGRARDVATIESSGSALLDGAAEAGAEAALGLPHLYGRIRIPIRFSLRSE